MRPGFGRCEIDPTSTCSLQRDTYSIASDVSQLAGPLSTPTRLPTLPHGLSLDSDFVGIIYGFNRVSIGIVGAPQVPSISIASSTLNVSVSFEAAYLPPRPHSSTFAAAHRISQCSHAQSTKLFNSHAIGQVPSIRSFAPT